MWHKGIPVIEGQRQPLGYQQITDLSSPVTLAPPSGTRLAVIQCDTQNVRWRDDVTAPTSTVGMLLATGDDKIYTGDFAGIQFIEVVAGANLNISYYS